MERTDWSLGSVVQRVALAAAVLPALMFAACYVDHAVAVRNADAGRAGGVAIAGSPADEPRQ